MIRHILLITFKGEASPDDIAAVRAAFLAIPHQVSGVLAVEWGQNDSPEGRAEGFTHSVLMTFADEAARQLAQMGSEGDAPLPSRGVSLRQRLLPFLGMVRLCQQAGQPIVWGV